jgi:hypothetical protein
MFDIVDFNLSDSHGCTSSSVKLASHFSIFRQASEEELLAGGLGFFQNFQLALLLLLWFSGQASFESQQASMYASSRKVAIISVSQLFSRQ